MRSYVSRFVWCVWLPYSIVSWPNPIPGSPALLNDVLSVPPVWRLVVVIAPATPRSLKDASAWRRMSAAAGGPNTLAPRARPVPESMLRYASSFANSGFGSSADPKCSLM